LRIGLLLTQVELAEKAKVSSRLVINIENRLAHPATDLSKAKLARALGVHVTDIWPEPIEGHAAD
jgi:DNA-binding XRE family transcriptional regulator